MRSRLHPLPSLVTATLLLAVTSPLPMPANPLGHRDNTVQSQKAKAEVLSQQGTQEYRNRKYQESLKTYQQLLAQSATQERTILGDGNELPFDEKVAVAQLLQRGTQEYRNRKYQEALKTYQQVLAIRRELGDKAGIASALHNIGTIYFRLRQTNQAKKFLQEALVIRKQIGDKAGEARTLYNIQEIDQNAKYNIQEIHQNPNSILESVGGELSLLFDDDEKQSTPPPPPVPSGEREIISDPPHPSSPSSNRNTVPYTPPYIASPSGDREAMPTR
jgi:tetratricopeptide (TPR) repeat protein